MKSSLSRRISARTERTSGGPAGLGSAPPARAVTLTVISAVPCGESRTRQARVLSVPRDAGVTAGVRVGGDRGVRLPLLAVVGEAGAVAESETVMRAPALS